MPKNNDIFKTKNIFTLFIHSFPLFTDRDVFRGGVIGAMPPWTSEIYWFRGVFRPQRVLSPPGEIKNSSPSWTNSWIRPCLKTFKTRKRVKKHNYKIFWYTLLIRKTQVMLVANFVYTRKSASYIFEII